MSKHDVDEMDSAALEGGGTLAGLTAVVTGGTRGLGLALVQALRRGSAEVAFVARSATEVAAVARETGAVGIVGDVARKTDTHRIALEIGASVAHTGVLDLLVNNASSLGPVPLRPLGDTDCEDLEAALATNLVGPFRLTKALLGPLTASARARTTHGATGAPSVVLNVSSDAAAHAYAGWGAYGASKAALSHLSAIWDEELRAHGVRVRAHDPGDMDTALHALALPDADRASLKRPAQAALELLTVVRALREGGA